MSEHQKDIDRFWLGKVFCRNGQEDREALGQKANRQICTHGNNECSSRPCSELLIHDTLSVSLGLLPIGEGYFLDENGINRAEPEKGENK